MSVYVTVDIGGTHARIATFETLQKPDVVDYHEFDLTGNHQADMVELHAEIDRICGSRPKAVGLGIAGMFNHEGILVTSPNLPNWEGLNVGHVLGGPLHTKVVVGNDANVAALGEAVYYGGTIPRPFWYVTWGTGIGVRLVGYDGKRPMVPISEFGHQILDLKAKSVDCDHNPVKRCKCGKAGCWETLCGGAGIRKRYRKPAEELTEREWNQVCRDFAIGLRNLVAMNPGVNRIVIGGGVMVKQRTRLATINRHLRDNIGMFSAPELKIVSSGERAGVVGGLALLKTRTRPMYDV